MFTKLCHICFLVWHNFFGRISCFINVQSTYEPGGAWAPEAVFGFYLHGPLRRHVVGDSIQGLDYTYTLEGWLIAINHPQLLTRYDPGHESSATRGKGLFGMILNYYLSDFNRISSPEK